MRNQFLIAMVMCAACDTRAPVAIENVPLPGEWTLVAVNDSPVPANPSYAHCIQGEQMRVEEDGSFSRAQRSSVYTCQDPEYFTSLTGHWVSADAGYLFSQDEVNCYLPPATAKVTGNTLVVDWLAWSPSRGNPNYCFVWTFTYEKK